MRSSSSIAALIAAGSVNSDKHGSEVSNQGTAGVRRAIKDPPAAAVPTTDGRGPGPVWIHPIPVPTVPPDDSGYRAV